MNTPNNPTPGNNSPQEDPKTDPKVNQAEQEVITNADEADHVTNKDGAVADTGAIESDLSESEPDTALNADNHITNDDGKSDTTLDKEDIF
ncbi:hypothetical protein D0C36_11865 [Mucilaginibacter conchicola]|uniref:Uncharacterized protein n=1 Tax=Mucilaginibacter conchicola TaxID=2303333 RepID=A0A372NS78_9SPHI|nr:hypothetical protein [Mucilaginibacter conchicola]RFZ92133.1 hypothetical protein D0C36_11865 [Mucilaginibacter conchicola]